MATRSPVGVVLRALPDLLLGPFHVAPTTRPTRHATRPLNAGESEACYELLQGKARPAIGPSKCDTIVLTRPTRPTRPTPPTMNGTEG